MPTHARPCRTIMLGASVAAVLLGAGRSSAGNPPADDPVDVGSAKDKLRVYTDGKKHFLALIPFDYSGPFFFYGDGQTFWSQRSFGGGRNGDESFNRSFWEPRVANPGQSKFELLNKQYRLDCGGRDTVFTPLPEPESQKMIATAKFLRPRWKRQSYWLAHDDKAHYYYVDRMREPEGNKEFRLFVGPRGDLKLQKMTKVVSDGKGDIFSTKGGQLRLVTSGSAGTWIVGKQKTPLVIVPIEDNHVLLYKDLGVYAGEKLGTPCDDLL